MSNYVILVTVIMTGILLAVAVTTVTSASDSEFSTERKVLNLDQGNITGYINSNGGQPYVEYLRIPLKLQKNTAPISTNNSILESILNSNNSSTEELNHLNCVFLKAEIENDQCIFFNVYTTTTQQLNGSNTDLLPVKFYNLQENQHYPQYDPSSGVILATMDSKISDFLDKDKVISGLTMEWLHRNIAQFGGDSDNIHTIIAPGDIPQMEEPQFSVGYELLESDDKKPIHVSDSKKFIRRNENSSVTSLIEETSTSQDNDNEVTTISP